jgi:hypothetical protein
MSELCLCPACDRAIIGTQRRPPKILSITEPASIIARSPVAPDNRRPFSAISEVDIRSDLDRNLLFSVGLLSSTTMQPRVVAVPERRKPWSFAETRFTTKTVVLGPATSIFAGRGWCHPDNNFRW